MSKVFVVAGETSGDLVGSWFVRNKMSNMLPDVTHIEGVGGEALAAAGVKLLWVDLRGAFYSSRAVQLWMVYSDLLSQSLEQVLPAV